MVEQLVVISVFLMLGGMLKGVAGMGTPVVAVPAIAAFFGVPYAIAVLVFPNIVTNAWQVWQFRATRRELAFLPVFVAAGVVGTLAGTWLLVALPGHTLSLALGVIVLAYIALRLARPHWKIERPVASRYAPAVGTVSGILQGAMGISAPVSVTFLNSLRLPRPEFAFAVSSLFLGFTLVQLVALPVAGILTWRAATISVIAVGPVLAGMWLGNHLASRLDAKAFDRLILLVLAAIALKLFYDFAAHGSAG